ncbi:hypothetical protein C0J52_27956 [Blattella germanica]|nr:hypothetical protein C0J52_27956 [Blattella germanica]
MGCHPREHCRPLFQELGILTVASLYILSNLVYMFSHYDERKSFSGLHNHETRNNRDLVVPRHRLAKTSNSHIVMASNYLINCLEILGLLTYLQYV